jgi:hypothetical protein
LSRLKVLFTALWYDRTRGTTPHAKLEGRLCYNLIKWEMNVREFGPIEPTIFVSGRVLLAVLVSCAGSIEV